MPPFELFIYFINLVHLKKTS